MALRCYLIVLFDFKGHWGHPGHLVMPNASSYEIVWRIFAKFDENGLVNRSQKCHKFWDRVKCTDYWAGPCCMNRWYGGTFRLPHSYIFRKYSIFWLSRPLNCRKQWSKKQKIWHHFHALYGQQIYSHMRSVEEEKSLVVTWKSIMMKTNSRSTQFCCWFQQHFFQFINPQFKLFILYVSHSGS